MPGLTATRDELIGAARNGPELLAEARQADPALAKRLQGESTVASKTLWGSALTMILVWCSAKYGLGWDPTFSAELAGFLALVVHAIVHWLINQPLIQSKFHIQTRADVHSYLDNSVSRPILPPNPPTSP